MESEVLEQLKQLKPRQIAEHSKSFFAKYYMGLDVPEHQRKWYDYCAQSFGDIGNLIFLHGIVCIFCKIQIMNRISCQ